MFGTRREEDGRKKKKRRMEEKIMRCLAIQAHQARTHQSPKGWKPKRDIMASFMPRSPFWTESLSMSLFSFSFPERKRMGKMQKKSSVSKGSGKKGPYLVDPYLVDPATKGSRMKNSTKRKSPSVQEKIVKLDKDLEYVMECNRKLMKLITYHLAILKENNIIDQGHYEFMSKALPHALEREDPLI